MSVGTIGVACHGTENTDAALKVALLMQEACVFRITGISARGSHMERRQDRTWVPDKSSEPLPCMIAH